MKSEWAICSLGDIICFQRGYDLPKSKMKGGSYPVVGSNGIIGYHNEYTTPAPSITVGRSGNIGTPFLHYGKSWSHNTTLFIKEYKKSDPIFIFYLLKTLNLHNYAGGSAVPTLNRNHIHNLKIKIPKELEYQRKIGFILSIFDKKIMLNTNINDNLEQQARAIYEEHFEKKESSLFTHTSLAQVTKIVRERVGNLKIPVFAAVSTGKLELSEEYFSKQVYSKSLEKYLVVRENAFAYNPARINIGSIGMNDHGYKGCVSPIYIVWECEPEYQYFFKFFITSKKFQEHVKIRASGSVRQSLSYTDFCKIDILYPPIGIVREFNRRYKTILDIQVHLLVERLAFSKLRDLLLPKLMSGELDVSDIDI